MKEKTEIVIILDRSGSMGSIKDKTIESFNSFVRDQQAVEGEASISLIQFDDKYQVDYINSDLKYAKFLDSSSYVPRGMTRLNDAIGKTITDVGTKLNNLAENEKPNKVLVVILTDGFENDSKEFTTEQIKSMIEHQTTKYSWVFLYLGANQDAILSAKTYGINPQFAATFSATEKGARGAFNAVSSYTTMYRSKTSVSASLEDLYKEEE